MIRIAVLASGRGSNFEAILRAVGSGTLRAEIVALVSDRAEAPALEIARKAGVPALHVPPTRGARETTGAPADPAAPEQRRREHEERILESLAPLAPRFLVLAGYMRILTPRLIEAFRSERGYSRIVNVHPSLLPSFPGVESYRQAFDHGAKVTGATVHLVEREVDSGPICAQEAFSIADCRSAADVEARGLAVEHRLFPQTLSWVLPEKFEFERSPPRVVPS